MSHKVAQQARKSLLTTHGSCVVICPAWANKNDKNNINDSAHLLTNADNWLG